MARTITEIQSSIAESLVAKFPNLSKSSVAEWRLLSHCVAMAIHLFEIILDKFKIETEDKIKLMAPGTLRWYAEMSRRFQDGFTLEFDTKTAKYYYPTDEPQSRIVSVVAVSASELGYLAIKVAKKDAKGNVTQLTEDELVRFKAYIDTIKVVGTKCSIISSPPDIIRYGVIVVYDPIYTASLVEAQVKRVLQEFRLSIDFDGRFYIMQFADAMLHCDGVITAHSVYVARKGATDLDFTEVDVVDELHSGYFDYDNQSVISLISGSDV